MKVTTYKSTAYLLIFGSCVTIPFFLIGSPYFPHLGLAVSLALTAIMAYTCFANRSRYTTLLFGVIIALCWAIFWRANMALTLLNTIAILYIGSVMIEQQRAAIFSALHVMLAPIKVFIESLAAHNHYPLSLMTMRSRYQAKIGSPAQVIPAVGLTIFVLLLIVPLLGSANPIFGSLVGNIIHVLNLTKFIDTFLSNPVALARWFLFFILLFFLPQLASTAQNETKVKLQPIVDKVFSFLTLPKIVTIAVLLVFFITQMQLYMANGQELAALGYTNSKLAREVFGQLSMVVLIVFALIYNDRGQSRLSKVTTWFLLLEAVFLGLIATKSDVDYIVAYGLTYKRLWGIVTVLWLFGTLKAYAYAYWRQKSASWFIQTVFAYAIILLLAVNIVNFDYLIAHTAKPHANGGVDYLYLASLAPESDSYQTTLPVLIEYLAKTDKPSYEQVYAADRLVNQIENIRVKIQQNQWRSYTVAELEAYKKTISFDIIDYRMFISEKYNSALAPTTPPPNTIVP